MRCDSNDRTREPDGAIAPVAPAAPGSQSLSYAGEVVRPEAGDSDSQTDWRRILAQAIRDPQELCKRLRLPSELAEPAASAGFSLLAPEGFVRRMRAGDPNDPLLLQVLPTKAELLDAHSPTDAVGDLAAASHPGLLQKYEGRALMMLGGACAVNCRYCFRRHFPYADVPNQESAWRPALDHLAADTSVHELILSGGDPLLNSDARLERLIAQAARIPHLHTLRIHTRTLVVLPERLTDRLIALLRESRLNTIVVLHINHANEIDNSVCSAMIRLAEAGVMLFNQSVLLRRVNDTAEALIDLSQQLIASRITPYYLHQVDRVPGSSHFTVAEEHGVRLVEAMRERLPGYAIPRYVKEIAGRLSKTVIA